MLEATKEKYMMPEEMMRAVLKVLKSKTLIRRYKRENETKCAI